MINRKFFFDHVRSTLFSGSLTGAQTLGMSGILDVWEGNPANTDTRKLAYMLATTFHETDRKMQPITEYGSADYFDKRYGPPPVGKNPGLAKTLGNNQAGDGARFRGRGFVQLTGRANYEKWTALLNQDLTSHPELALDLQIATRILFKGMTAGSFTGKKLGDYFNGTTEDWVNARRIINKLDKANNIAGYGKLFYAAISQVP